MQGFNAWCSMDQVFKGELWGFVRNGLPAITFTDINLLQQDTVDFFNGIYDEGALDRLFVQWDAAGRNYKMWSFYADKPSEGTQIIKADLDMLMNSYPQDFSMMGAWNCSSGTEVGAGAGLEWYPVPHQVVNFMPDIMTDPGDPEADPPIPPTFETSTEPRDINLLFGQTPRNFGSFYA